MTKTKVPRLRFSEFSGEWKEEPLENRIEFLKGNDSGNYKLPILTISAGKGWMLQSDRFGNVLAGKELKNYTLLKKGQLSYNHGNSKLAKYGAVFSLKDYNEALVPKVYHSFKILNGDSDFIEKLFESKKTDRQLRKMITSGARMDGLLNINKQSFGSILINFPILIEQQKIGNFFAKQDKLIELQTQKVDQLKKLKRGYLQKMFPQEGETVPRLRFSGFSGEWKEEKLVELLKIGKSGGTPSTRNKEFYKGEIPFLSIKDVTTSNGTIFDTEKHISQEAVDNSSTWIVPKNALTLSMYASVGSVAKFTTNIATSQAFFNMIFNENVFVDYMYHFLKYYDYCGKWNRLIAKGTQGNLNATDIKNIIVFVPKLDEQQKIGSFFAKLDKLIEEQSNKLDQLKQQKKAYLQKMFI
ncbi:restriction endonuclease subunit S [Apilactobacillus kunkeei]|uniref:restriction endonuclease subunit S n=1 Tax=Apilactobacillus kunkeei TaxID=148814 RepID=UPI0022095CE6|nr:restriction endonuclease subunit S [Apilactobacillus kunkeei]UZX33644.1 restriction endonuclease subunit S [Apilactobacillus kunkeei]CAI2580555.1 hypothetical protein AKUH4B206J_04650 [Apilactobacillus kunkeei]